MMCTIYSWIHRDCKRDYASFTTVMHTKLKEMNTMLDRSMAEVVEQKAVLDYVLHEKDKEIADLKEQISRLSVKPKKGNKK